MINKRIIFATIMSSIIFGQNLSEKPRKPFMNTDDISFLGTSNRITSILDEAKQFLSDAIIAGLDMDFSGKPFGPMPFLMAIAEDVTKVHAKCVETGEPALYSFRKVDNDETVMIGEKKEYQPLSRKAFISKSKKS